MTTSKTKDELRVSRLGLKLFDVLKTILLALLIGTALGLIGLIYPVVTDLNSTLFKQILLVIGILVGVGVCALIGRVLWKNRDTLFKRTLLIASCLILLLTAGIVYALISQSLSTLSAFGFKFITSSNWDSQKNIFGALPFISGTLMTALLALFFCIPFSLPVALFNGEYFRGTRMATILSSVVDLLAGIPSIVYGLWGFYTLRPIMISLGVNAQGFGILLASIVLAIMIIPYASSLSTEFIAMVPNDLKEAAYSLGATNLEVIRKVSLPVAGSGIFASYILALGRALGETMAVTMLIGNTNNIPHGLRDTGNTMASVIANQFGEADGLKLSALMEIGLLLFLITAVINFIAKYIMKLVNKE